jgi:hypothetical protein
MNKLFFSCKLLVLLFLLLHPLRSLAITVDDLIKNGELTVTTQVISAEKIVAKQPFTIQIEIATNRWFAKGTRIKAFTLEEAVILPISELAINGTKKIKGVTWASQTREVTIYPMQVGIYDIPAISIEVSINTEHDGIVNGTITTKALEIETYKPEALAEIENYLVTAELVVAIEGGFDVTKEYQQGDAVTQTISMTAKDVPAMMITPLVYDNLPGISVYQKAAKVSDKKSRGLITGQRVETYTYIFEQAGEYTLPEQVIYWWNTDTETLEREVIPEIQWSVSGTIGAEQSQKSMTAMSLVKQINISYLLLFILLLTVLIILIKYRQIIVNKYNVVTQKEYRIYRQKFFSAVEKHHWQAACHWLYHATYRQQQIDSLNENVFVATLNIYYQHDSERLALLEKLFQLAYHNGMALFSVNEAKILLARKQHYSISINNIIVDANKINLNPTKQKQY